jgi:YidC/Oxa1 family membrane protein insertase
MNALRAKYKNDKQRLQRETMELYRKHGVNPMGGCLPIVIQIPIFYALYVTLTVAVELQQSPLLCLGKLWGRDVWICDLSVKDPTYLLPLLMGASMFIQQKMTPTVGDPRQAKIMLLLPVVFTFTFLELPAGLVLYWLVNNVLSIVQQTYTNRGAGKIETKAKGGSRPARETKRA